MSGGVDSAVAAALLKKQGYDVIGATMHIWFDSQQGPCDDERGCCGYGAIDDARRVAHRLGIPHYAFCFREEFDKAVIADFCDEYGRGRTPNPCIRCNKHLKFDILLKKAKGLGADLLATGHYAIRQPLTANRSPHAIPRFLLMRPKDRAKDQTYFLYFLKQRQLAHILFPLGEMTKPEVRKYARELGLTVADKKESQEVCFAPRGTYPEFLKSRFPALARPGPILNTSGKVIGRHEGIIHYTIGQRRRIGIARATPYYVIAIDPTHNSITVGDKSDVCGSELRVTDLSLVNGTRLKEPIRAGVQIRYRSEAAPALIAPLDAKTARITLDTPQWAITPGQAAVFYDGDNVIGGGTIASSLDAGAA
jgi:tRNA-uridine 2-sulfurtransferase